MAEEIKIRVRLCAGKTGLGPDENHQGPKPVAEQATASFCTADSAGRSGGEPRYTSCCTLIQGLNVRRFGFEDNEYSGRRSIVLTGHLEDGSAPGRNWLRKFSTCRVRCGDRRMIFKG